MGIVRITEEDVKKKVRNYRIKQTFFVLGVMAVSVIIIVSLIVYYNIKQRALVGALYLSDENSAVQLVNNLMYLNINKYTLQAGSDAMLEAGYSAKGYTHIGFYLIAQQILYHRNHLSQQKFCDFSTIC